MEYTNKILPIAEFQIPSFHVDVWWKSESDRFLLFESYWTIGRYEYTERGKGRFIEVRSNRVLRPTFFTALPSDPTD